MKTYIMIIIDGLSTWISGRYFGRRLVCRYTGRRSVVCHDWKL